LVDIGRLRDTLSDRYEIGAQIAAAEEWENEWEPFFRRAAIAAALGQLDEAMTLLWQAYALGKPYDFWDHRMGYFIPLWDLQDWKDLMSPKG
jgi:hypothetical protein